MKSSHFADFQNHYRLVQTLTTIKGCLSICGRSVERVSSKHTRRHNGIMSLPEPLLVESTVEIRQAHCRCVKQKCVGSLISRFAPVPLNRAPYNYFCRGEGDRIRPLNGRGCNIVTEGPRSKSACFVFAKITFQRLCEANLERRQTSKRADS